MYRKLMANGRLTLHDIHFDVGMADLRSESERALSAIGLMLQQNPDLRLRIEVHTDNAGAADKNQLLSEARAREVVRYLGECGVDAGRLVAVGCGAARPIAANDTPQNRQRNRRVELIVLEQPSP